MTSTEAMGITLKYQRRPNLHDMHEDIFREIFQYLNDEFVYFTLRSVSRNIKGYVDAYIQLGGIFMSVSRRDNVTEIWYVLEQNDKVRTIFSKLSDPYPYPPTRYYKEQIVSTCWSTHTREILVHTVAELGGFGAKFKGKIVIGVHSYNMEEESKTRKIKASWPFDINEYNAKENKWIPIQSIQSVNDCENYDYLLGSGVPIKCWCQIGDSSLIIFYNEMNTIYTRLIHINIAHEHSTTKTRNTLKRFGESRSTFSSYMVAFPFQLRGISEFSVIRIASNKIMLVGGIINNNVGHSMTKYNQQLWQGTLNKDGQNLTWARVDLIEIVSIKIHRNPLCFKLKDNVYITGGTNVPLWESGGIFVTNDLLSCDRYNLSENKYYTSVYTLPYILNYDETSILTNDNETFAIILDDKYMKILLFTEDQGFKEFRNFSPMETKRKMTDRLIFNVK